MMKKLFSFLLIILFAASITAQERAVIVSNGIGGGSWNSPPSWNPQTVPGSGDDVTILAGDGITSTTGTDAATTITVNSGAILTIGSGATLTTSGDLFVYGWLHQNGTLDVGDAVDDGLIVDGASADFAVGNNSTTNVSGYYKQDNGSTISSLSGFTADLNMATSGALNDATNPVLAFLNGSIAGFNGADVDFNVQDGNTNSTVPDVVVEAPGTSELSWIGTVTFGSGGSTTVTDWDVEMEGATGFYRTAINVGSGSTFSLVQTTWSGSNRIFFTHLDLTSGDFEIAPLTNLQVSSGFGINMAGGTLTIKSDATGSGELICETVAVSSTVEQFIVGQQWHQITPITTGTTTANIFQNNNPQVWLMEWLNGTQNWSYIIDPELDDALNVGQGYVLTSDFITRAYDFTFEYSGNLKVDNYSKPSYTAATGDYELIGNPFSSSLEVINGTDGLINSTNLNDDIWVWNPSNDNYATATGGTGGTHPGIVAPGQSFFVQATANGSTTLLLDKDNRTFFATNNFYKSGGLIEWDDNFGKGAYVMLKVNDGDNNDAVFVNFGESGTPGFERNYDGYKRFGYATSPQLYLVEDDNNLTIDYLQTLNEGEELVVKMNFKAGKDGEHNLAANLDSLLSTIVTLEDTKTGTMHEFNTGEYYSFNSSTADSPDRFLLHFNYTPTGIEDPTDNVESSLNIYAYDKAVYISNKDNNATQSNITIYDLVGRQVYSNRVELGSSTRIPINVSNTYLIVKVIKGSEVVTQKVFIQ